MAEKFELLGLLRSTGQWEMLHHGDWDEGTACLPLNLGDPDPGTTAIENSRGATVIRRCEFAAFRIRRFG